MTQCITDPVEIAFLNSSPVINDMYDSLKREFPFIEQTEKVQLASHEKNIMSCRRWRARRRLKS